MLSFQELLAQSPPALEALLACFFLRPQWGLAAPARAVRQRNPAPVASKAWRHAKWKMVKPFSLRRRSPWQAPGAGQRAMRPGACPAPAALLRACLLWQCWLNWQGWQGLPLWPALRWRPAGFRQRRPDRHAPARPAAMRLRPAAPAGPGAPTGRCTPGAAARPGQRRPKGARRSCPPPVHCAARRRSARRSATAGRARACGSCTPRRPRAGNRTPRRCGRPRPPAAGACAHGWR